MKMEKTLKNEQYAQEDNNHYILLILNKLVIKPNTLSVNTLKYASPEVRSDKIILTIGSPIKKPIIIYNKLLLLFFLLPSLINFK